ncbi:MAG TPA: hypothetical protein HPP83_03740, partial [Candidatus Hydrogenedentes bacterium]|nr:hypothetical protein [Candidatus Hydrogenedentota bacterium]
YDENKRYCREDGTELVRPQPTVAEAVAQSCAARRRQKRLKTLVVVVITGAVCVGFGYGVFKYATAPPPRAADLPGSTEGEASLVVTLEELAEAIPESALRAAAMTQVAVASAKAGRHGAYERLRDRALYEARSLEDAQQKAACLRYVMCALAKGGQFADAEDLMPLFREVPPTAWARDVEEALIYAVAQGGHYEETMRRIEALEDRQITRRGKEAGKTASETITVTASQRRNAARRNAGRDLAQAGHFSEARRVAEGITEEEWRCEALTVIAGFVGRGGDYEEVARIEALVPDGVCSPVFSVYYKTQVRSYYGHALVRAGQLDRAMAVLDELEDGYFRTLVINEIVTALVERGEHIRARELAVSPKEQEDRDRALYALTFATARLGNAERVDRLLREVRDTKRKNWVLVALVGGLAQNGRVDDAAKRMQSLRDHEARCEAAAMIVLNWPDSQPAPGLFGALFDLDQCLRDFP